MWTLHKKPGKQMMQRGELVYFEGNGWNTILGKKVFPVYRSSFTQLELILAANDGMLEAGGTIDPITVLDSILKPLNDTVILQCWMGFSDAPLYWHREYPSPTIRGGIDTDGWMFPVPASSTRTKKFLGALTYEDSPYEYPLLEFFWTREKHPGFAVSNNGPKATKVAVKLMISVLELGNAENSGALTPAQQAQYLEEERLGQTEIKHILSEDCYRW